MEGDSCNTKFPKKNDIGMEIIYIQFDMGESFIPVSHDLLAEILAA